MEKDVSIQVFEKSNSISNQDWQDRIADFVGQTKTKTFAGNNAAPNNPDAAKVRPKAVIYQSREIARIKLDAVSGSRQITAGEHENGFVPVGPTESVALKTKGSLVGS